MAGRGDASAGQRHAGRRHVPVRHRGLGKTQHRRRSAGLGHRPVHPVRPVRDRLPAFGHPRPLLRRRRAGRSGAPAPPTFKSAPGQRARLSRQPLHAAVLCGGLHRAAASASRSARRTARASPTPRPSTWPPRRRCSRRSGRISPSSNVCRSTIAPWWISPTCAASSSWSRCSSSPAPAAAAARRPIFGCCRSCSATGCRSPTRPAVPRSMAAICRSRPGPRTAKAAARPGRTRCSRTTPSSASASGWPPTCMPAWPRGCCANWRRSSDRRWSRRCWRRRRSASPRSWRSADGSPS